MEIINTVNLYMKSLFLYLITLIVGFFYTSDEPITSVLEDLKSLTSAVMKDDLSSSDEDDD